MAAVCVCAAVLLWRADLEAETGLPVGGHDFIAYWSGYDVAADGGDPYDDETLRRVQVQEHPRYDTGAQRYWNPPWALLVLAPVLELPFRLATSVWLVLTLASAVVAVHLSWRLLRPGDEEPIPPLLVGLSLVFVPFLECIRLGQMSAVLAAVVLGGLLALRAGRDGWAGVLLGLTIVKPQAVLVLLLVLGVHVVATRRWVVAGAALATVALVLGASLVLLPSAWSGWELGGVSPTHWHTSTVASWARATLDDTGDAPTWPLLAVPAVALAVALPWALRRRREVEWSAIPVLLAISLLVAPYAWIADAVLLLPVQVAVVIAVTSGQRNRMTLGLALVAVQVGSLIVRSLPGTGQQHQIVLPLGLLAVAVAWKWSQDRESHGVPGAPEVQEPGVLQTGRPA